MGAPVRPPPDWCNDPSPLLLNDDDCSDAWLRWRAACVADGWLQDERLFAHFIERELPEPLVLRVALAVEGVEHEYFDDSLILDQDGDSSHHRKYIISFHCSLRLASPPLSKHELETFYVSIALAVIAAVRWWRDTQPERDAERWQQNREYLANVESAAARRAQQERAIVTVTVPKDFSLQQLLSAIRHEKQHAGMLPADWAAFQHRIINDTEASVPYDLCPNSTEVLDLELAHRIALVACCKLNVLLEEEEEEPASDTSAQAQPQGGTIRRGGTFSSLNVKGCPAKELVCADRMAPTHQLEPVEGYVPYRHDTLLLRALFGMTNCLLEAMMAATGMGITELGVNRSALDKYMGKWHINPRDGPSMGVLDKVLQAARSPFRLPNCRGLNANLKWTGLLNLTEGIFLMLALAWDDGKRVGHFVVFDSWRDLLIVGPKWGAVRVAPEDKNDEERACCFLLEHYQLIMPLHVCKLVVAANRISETKFNTPAHYANLTWRGELGDSDERQRHGDDGNGGVVCAGSGDDGGGDDGGGSGIDGAGGKRNRNSGGSHKMDKYAGLSQRAEAR